MSFRNKPLKENLERISKPSLDEQTEKRYIVTLDLFVYADNDQDAKDQGREIANELDLKYDNKASVVSVHQQDFGKTKTRKLD